MTESSDRDRAGMSLALRLCGLLEIGALRVALEHVVRRHDRLRGQLPVWMPVRLISGFTKAEREAALWHAVAELARCEPAAARPVRAVLLIMGPTDNLLLLTVHRTVADGWSVGALLDQLGTCYRMILDGEESQLPALPSARPDAAPLVRTIQLTTELSMRPVALPNGPDDVTDETPADDIVAA